MHDDVTEASVGRSTEHKILYRNAESRMLGEFRFMRHCLAEPVFAFKLTLRAQVYDLLRMQPHMGDCWALTP